MKKRNAIVSLILCLGLCVFASGCDKQPDYSEALRHIEELKEQAKEQQEKEEAENLQNEEQAVIDDKLLEDTFGEVEAEEEAVDDTDEIAGNSLDDLISYSDDQLRECAATNVGRYAYEKLSPDDKKVYNEIQLSLLDLSEGTKVSCSDENNLNKIFQCVSIDHPEIFWVTGYTYTKFSLEGDLIGIGFKGNNTMDKNMIADRQSAIDNYVSTCMAGMPNGDDYSKIKYVYEYIISHTEYDENSSDNQNICSVFINGKSVCQGYAKATQYLLNKAGIVCTFVMGTTGSQNHAWNIVSSNGSYYQLDTTWGDASFQIEGGLEGDIPEISYDYLCVTDADILRTHTIKSVIDYPACISMKDNYYVREGAYFSSVDNDQISRLFSDAAAVGKEAVTLKASDDIVYSSLKQYLITDQHIFNFLPNNSSVNYWEIPDTMTMTFRL